MKALKLSLIVAITAVMCSCSITQPLALTNNPIGKKEGRSETISIFGGGGTYAAHYHPIPLYSTGFYGIIFNKEFSIYEAAKKAGIQKIATVDMRTDWYVFFTKRTYIVTGE